MLLGLGVLAGAGLGTWATGTWPFDKASYCWGAWQESDGDVPDLLDSDLDGYERTGKQSAAPRKGGRATCSVTLKEKSAAGDSSTQTGDPYGGSVQETDHQERVTAEVAPVPRGATDRRAWLRDFLDAESAPLPDGLPGLVGNRRAVFVLPEKCDTSDGRPTVVTVEGSSNSPLRSAAFVGSEAQVAELLLSLANKAAGQAGCAPGEPFAVTSPLAAADADDDLSAQGRELCRIPGFRFDLDKNDRYKARIGAVRDDLQTCSVIDETDVRNPTSAALFVMVSRPRLAALFTGLAPEASPGKGWRGKGKVGDERGLLTVTCNGRPTVFFMELDGLLSAAADSGPRRVFAATAGSVADRLGCAPVAPAS
ncbi:hypothetical protein [Streptomyces sp. B15]|uniref:hypothetical protein n=1 Tax=Streptomyces sp. B15 TaxID=1537797 RepID=UPI001B391B21|nr:hypothetical protein [Streptomyces sp. B15]MBQ1122688.1 hypothetical protein [Streptomyces sp. B15]